MAETDRSDAPPPETKDDAPASAERRTPPGDLLRSPFRPSEPSLSVTQEDADEETLRALTEELRSVPRGRLETKRYGNRLSNAPGALSPHAAGHLAKGRRSTGAPEVEIGQTEMGRATWAAIEEELARDPAHPEVTIAEAPAGPATLAAIEDELSGRSTLRDPSTASATAALELFEMLTFVIRGDASELTTESIRRQFVEERLLHRLPVASMSEVARIDITPWTSRDTSIVRVWCMVLPRVE